MHEERFTVVRQNRRAHPASRALLWSTVVATPPLTAAVLWAFPLVDAGGVAVGVLTALLLLVTAIDEALGLGRNELRDLPSVELVAGLTDLHVQGRTLPLSSLRWRRRLGDVVLLDRGEPLVIRDVADPGAVDLFLTRHRTRAQQRHGDGKLEVPAALERARARDPSTG